MTTIERLDERMFELFEELKSRGVIKYKRDFANACGLPEQNFYNISQKRNHFNFIHAANVCLFYSINMNWIIETEDNLFIKPNQNRKQTVNKIDLKEAI
jgi:hypothetical protein